MPLAIAQRDCAIRARLRRADPPAGRIVQEQDLAHAGVGAPEPPSGLVLEDEPTGEAAFDAAGPG